MTTYSDQLQSINRTPILYMILVMDYCTRTFGSAPCLATGEKCFNTWPTCKYKTAYDKTTKQYRFTSAETPLPFKNNERPYIQSVAWLPTEITDTLAVTGRIKFTLIDEPDPDIGIDPYLTSRSAFPDVPGTFWRKWLVRNSNFRGRPVYVYDGFLGMTEAEFLANQRYVGRIYDIQRNGGQVVIEVEDLLKSIESVEVPPKITAKLAADITIGATALTLDLRCDMSVFDSAGGWVIIGEEVIQYAGKNNSSRQLTGLTRGAKGTTAATHSKNDKVGLCKYYFGNPFDIIQNNMLQTDGGVPAGDIDSTAFSFWRGWPVLDVEYEALVTEPTKLKELIKEILTLLDASIWISENLKITIRRNLPNQPGRTYYSLTDAKHIIQAPGLDHGDRDRFTRTSIYWMKKPTGKMDAVASFDRVDIGIDADAEGENELNEAVDRQIMTRWINLNSGTEEQLAVYMRNQSLRLTRSRRDARPKLTCEIEIKDQDVKTGDYVTLDTDELVNPDGSPIEKSHFQVLKRTPAGNKLQLVVQQNIRRRVTYISAAGMPAYTGATEAQREYGFICDSNSHKMSNSDPAYRIY